MKNVFANPGTKFPSLVLGEVHVWKVSLHASPDLVRQLFETLAPEEQARAKRFAFERDEIRYIVAHAALRFLISKYTGISFREIQIIADRLGRPYLQSVNNRAGLHFSLSHSEELAAMAFCLDEELGIDIEQKRPEAASMEIAKRHFSESELRELRKFSGDEWVAGFFRCWTRKEAYLKALGVGLGMDLRSFEVTLESDEIAELRASDAEKWKVFPFRIEPEYCGAVVYRSTMSAVRLWSLDAPAIR